MGVGPLEVTCTGDVTLIAQDATTKAGTVELVTACSGADPSHS
jgi:hypothetical protein